MGEDRERTCSSSLIAILLHSLEPGGAQYRVVWLANRFIELGHSVHLLVINDRPSIGLKLNPRIDVRIIAGGAGKPTGMRSWITARALARYLRSERPDIFMSGVNLTHAVSIRSWRASDRAAPIVLRLCSNAKLWPQDISWAALGRRLWGRDEELYGEADALIAVSQNTAEVFRRIQSIGSRPIEIIYNPTATEELLNRPIQRSRGELRGVPTIVAAGTFYHAKDFPTLIRAFARIRKQGPARLVLLGDGEDRKRLQALAQALGLSADVDFPGWREELPEWIDRAAVVVSSSLFEGLPGTLIEAMALGCPVVATDCPGGSREILEDGALGPLVPVGDEAALATAILQVLECPIDPHRLRDGARRFAEEGKAEAYLQVFGKLMGDRAT